MRDWLEQNFNLWVVLLALALALGLMGLCVLVLLIFPPQAPEVSPELVLTVVPAPTATVTPGTPVSLTPTAGATAVLPPGTLAIGAYVQISGTGGDGLRLRAGPGTSNEPRFLGMEAEVFLVKDGPKDSDGLTWYLLEAPYDHARTGWAASKYLVVVAKPQP